MPDACRFSVKGSCSSPHSFDCYRSFLWAVLGFLLLMSPVAGACVEGDQCDPPLGLEAEGPLGRVSPAPDPPRDQLRPL